MLNRMDGRRTDGLERRQRICELLADGGYVDVGELSKQLAADSATIRRDLQKLEAEGAARRVHGGAYPESARQGVEIEFSLRMNFHANAKQQIARRAASLIKNGDTLYLDAGTTAFMVAQELVKHQGLVVATLRFRQWGEGVRLAGGRSGETRGIGGGSGGVLRRVAAAS